MIPAAVGCEHVNPCWVGGKRSQIADAGTQKRMGTSPTERFLIEKTRYQKHTLLQRNKSQKWATGWWTELGSKGPDIRIGAKGRERSSGGFEQRRTLALPAIHPAGCHFLPRDRDVAKSSRAESRAEKTLRASYVSFSKLGNELTN